MASVAQLVTNRTRVEYMELVNYLNKNFNKYNLFIGVTVENSIYKKGTPYYLFSVGNISVYALNAEELKGKVDVLVLARDNK